ncbi:MAG: hypothetical protein ACE5GB_06330, partial [Acidimicrobiales bacterium]
MHDHLTEEQVERLLAGDGDDIVAVTVQSIRRHFESIPPAAVDRALTAFVGVDLTDDNGDPTVTSDSNAHGPASQVAGLPNWNQPTRTRKMLSSFTGFAGTVTGKVLLGATRAAASVGGAHTAGVVDVPVLPDVDDSAVAAAPGDGVGDLIEGSLDSSDSDSSDDSDDPSSDDSSSHDPVGDAIDDAGAESTSTTTVPVAVVFEMAPRTFQVLDAGSVTIESDGTGGVVVVDAAATDGWAAEIETDEPGEAGVNFRSDDDRVDFRAEVEDGALRVRVRDRRTETIEELYYDSEGNLVDPASISDDSDSGDDSDEVDGPGSGSGDD